MVAVCSSLAALFYQCGYSEILSDSITPFRLPEFEYLDKVLRRVRRSGRESEAEMDTRVLQAATMIYVCAYS